MSVLNLVNSEEISTGLENSTTTPISAPQPQQAPPSQAKPDFTKDYKLWCANGDICFLPNDKTWQQKMQNLENTRCRQNDKNAVWTRGHTSLGKQGGLQCKVPKKENTTESQTLQENNNIQLINDLQEENKKLKKQLEEEKQKLKEQYAKIANMQIPPQH